MIEPLDLSRNFTERHPADAAKLLETLPASKSSEYLLSLSDPLAARIVTLLAADYAAACMPLLPMGNKIQLFRQMDIQTAVDIFRYLNAKEKYRLLNQLPFNKRLAIQTLNRYNKNNVGAWMRTDYLVVGDDKTIEEVIEYVQGSEIQNQDYVFVVSAKKQFVSVINTSQLLKASLKARITAVRTTSNVSLSARATIPEVAEHDAWKRFTMLPVVEYDKRLVGALMYSDLLEALEKSHIEFTAQTASIGSEALNLFSALFNNYLQLMNDLFKIMLRKT